jgi:hypothetical protein
MLPFREVVYASRLQVVRHREPSKHANLGFAGTLHGLALEERRD